MNRAERRPNRHIPRLCQSCQAPMSGQENGCWRCGARWADADIPTPTLRLIPGGAEGSSPAPTAPADDDYAVAVAVAVAVAIPVPRP